MSTNQNATQPAAHTPKWQTIAPRKAKDSLTGRDETIWGISTDGVIADVGVTNTKERAELIVRAVNSHASLVALNEELVAALKTVTKRIASLYDSPTSLLASLTDDQEALENLIARANAIRKTL